jgi:hypothetical protein
VAGTQRQVHSWIQRVWHLFPNYFVHYYTGIRFMMHSGELSVFFSNFELALTMPRHFTTRGWNTLAYLALDT